jgi:hypothetical protein
MTEPDYDRKPCWWVVASLAWIVFALLLVTALTNRNLAAFVYQGF